ncbi:hypothetical protein WA026_002029 [Henosepilachna vigintioctopunctata]|uniref:RHD domain-containing protein n=1 Tax=Henosepilachna vigintioctopunctata TaxID=420089 RepID=A0AAW1UV17_9CUCU
MATSSYENHQSTSVYVKIIEQPAPVYIFRYESEEKNSGLLQGASSTSDTKTFPSIQVVGYKGKAAVWVSLVTAEEPYRPHPHSLVGQGCCDAGVAFLPISTETMKIEFRNFKIRCVKKNGITEVLKRRKAKNIDPFKTGFSYPNTIDTTKVRLCFQVLLEGSENGKYNVPLQPVVSEIIVNKRNKPDLAIVELSDCVSYADGENKKIILLCEKIVKDDDIEVRFYEERNGKVVWEGFGNFQPNNVHKHVAISFYPPRYWDQDISEPVNVQVQMRRPSDGATSDSLRFQFIPLLGNSRKRQKMSSFVNSKAAWCCTEYTKYKKRLQSHSSMDVEEDVKGVLALSRTPEAHISSDTTFMSVKPETLYNVAQEERMKKQKNFADNSPPKSRVPKISTSYQENTKQTISQNVQWSPLPTRKDLFPSNSVNPDSTQDTASANITLSIPPISVNPNDLQISHIDRNIMNITPEVNQGNGSQIENSPSNFNHLIQPSLVNFPNYSSAINQIAQVIIQSIPPYISQMTQASLQNEPLSNNMENKTHSELLQRDGDTISTDILCPIIASTINLQDLADLRNSPSNLNSSMNSVFFNTPSAENVGAVSSTRNPSKQVATSNGYSQQAIESQSWNIPLNSMKKICEQPVAKPVQNELRAIIENINQNSELETIELHSGELGTYEESSELNNLSEVLSINLSFTDQR